MYCRLDSVLMTELNLVEVSDNGMDRNNNSTNNTVVLMIFTPETVSLSYVTFHLLHLPALPMLLFCM